MEYSYIGIDISKAKFDVFYNNRHFEVEQTQELIAAFLDEMESEVKQSKLAPLLFVCEASGGYEKVLVRALRKRGLGYHVAHANKVRAFARSKGYLAKTDKLDAHIIWEYAQIMKVVPDEITLCESREKIGDLVKRREQLIQDKLREKSRIDKSVDQTILSSQQSHIDWLEQEIKKIEQALDKLSNQDDIKSDMRLLTSMPGVGKLSAMYLVAFLPELGNASHKQIAALTGVAPYNRDSGQQQGKRFIYGGRNVVRRVLYMAAITSIKWNAELAAFYQQLIQRGKPAKVAIIAVIRKMLSALNSIMKRQTPWLQKENFSV